MSRFINVTYRSCNTEIELKRYERFSQVQAAIVDAFKIQYCAPHVRLQDASGQKIETWDQLNSLPSEYFEENGKYVLVLFKFLIVKYESSSFRIRFDGHGCIFDVRKAIQMKSGRSLTYSPSAYELFDSKNIPITTFDELENLPWAFSPEYGDLCAEISLGPTPMDKVRKLGFTAEDICEKDLSYLKPDEKSTFSDLVSIANTPDDIDDVIKNIKSRVKTETRQLVNEQHSLTLTGIIETNLVLPRAFYYAVTKCGRVLAAKVFHDSPQVFEQEVQALSKIGEHPNIVKFINHFSVEKYSFIVMPFYPRSVHQLLECDLALGLPLIATIAQNCFEALVFIHSKGFCYSDFKPANIMLESGEQAHAVLIDFGSPVPFGKSIRQFTRIYCLNYDLYWPASESFDWVCFGTTLADMAGDDFISSRIIYSLEDYVAEPSSLEPSLEKLITCCYSLQPVSEIRKALDTFIDTVRDQNSCNSDTVV